MLSEDSIFAVALIKQAFDQAQRSIRIIEAKTSTDIEMQQDKE